MLIVNFAYKKNEQFLFSLKNKEETWKKEDFVEVKKKRIEDRAIT